MRKFLYVVIAFCVYFTSAHIYKMATEAHFYYFKSASVWSAWGCPTHPELYFDAFPPNFYVGGAYDDEKCPEEMKAKGYW